MGGRRTAWRYASFVCRCAVGRSDPARDAQAPKTPPLSFATSDRSLPLHLPSPLSLLLTTSSTMEAVLSTHSRSPSPPFSNESSQSPASSHSSPESSDFLLTDAAPVSSYKLASTGGPVLLHSVGVPSKHAAPHSAGHWQPPLGFSPSPSFAIGKPDEDAEHAIFSEFIQEDAFE